MESRYNAREILEIAINIERNGAAYYRKASELFEEEKIKKLLLELAEWEEKHIEIFKQMAKSVETYIDNLGEFKPEEYIKITPRSMASLSVFSIRPYPEQIIKGIKDRREVLEKALKFEKDSIIFYQGLKNFAGNTEGFEKIDQIIAEEQKHIGIIQQSMKGL